eukprot:12848068-Alexandrium_andersonii.AAC.1
MRDGIADVGRTFLGPRELRPWSRPGPVGRRCLPAAPHGGPAPAARRCVSDLRGARGRAGARLAATLPCRPGR